MTLTNATNDKRSPETVSEAVYSTGFTIPRVLQELLNRRPAHVSPPQVVKVKRRVDRAMAQVVALAAKDGGGVVLNFEDEDTLFGYQFRPGMTITAHGVTPQRLRQMLLVACDALAKAEEVISNQEATA